MTFQLGCLVYFWFSSKNKAWGVIFSLCGTFDSFLITTLKKWMEKKNLLSQTQWSRFLGQLWACSQSTRLADWQGPWKRLLLLLLLWIPWAARLLYLHFSGVWMAFCVIEAPGQTCRGFGKEKSVSWWQHSSQMLFTRLLMLECWSCVINVAAKWLICFRADKMSSVCFNAAHCCISQKSAYNISQIFLHQKLNQFIFHDHFHHLPNH